MERDKQKRVAAEKREREEQKRLAAAQRQRDKWEAPAQLEADKPSAETPKVVHPLSPKPSGPDRVKPTLSKQLIAFLAIGVVLVVAGLVYLSMAPRPATPAAESLAASWLSG